MRLDQRFESFFCTNTSQNFIQQWCYNENLSGSVRLCLLLRSALLSKVCPISVNRTLTFLNWTFDITCTFVHLLAAIFSEPDVVFILFDMDLSSKNKEMGFIDTKLMNKGPFQYCFTLPLPPRIFTAASPI